MRRFFIEPTAISGRMALLGGADAHHLRKVLRLENGDEVELFSGDGLVHRARIVGGDRERVELTLLTSSNTPPDGLRIHLAQAMLKGKKMDLVVQKCTELGVAALHPYLSTHTKMPAPEPAKLQRWQRIIQESCKQCNQPWPPLCHPAAPLEQILTTAADHDLRLLCWEAPEAPPLRQVLATVPRPRKPLVLIGPEGGFDEAEVAAARAAGFLPAGLGRRVLRAETAAIAVVALLQFLYE